MRGFLTHEEKLNNKQLLDIWTVKAQVKGYFLDKAKAFTPLSDYQQQYEKFTNESKDTIAAIQLNQKNMQAFAVIQDQAALLHDLVHSKLSRSERAERLDSIANEIDKAIQPFLKTLSKEAQDQQTFMSAALLFDMCFNVKGKRGFLMQWLQLLGSKLSMKAYTTIMHIIKQAW